MSAYICSTNNSLNSIFIYSCQLNFLRELRSQTAIGDLKKDIVSFIFILFKFLKVIGKYFH
jgi:hypothetical protein